MKCRGCCGRCHDPTIIAMTITIMIVVCSFALDEVHGAKDNSYYPYPEFVNPNTYYRMYWKDAANVIEDMDEFESLYIKYHGCVWSAYVNSYQDSEDRDGAENDYWYLGSPQMFRANTAFSLYGTLKGSKVKGGCGKNTYINSFFSLAGVETVATPLNIDTSYANSYCKARDVDDGSGDRRTRRLANNDRYYDDGGQIDDVYYNADDNDDGDDGDDDSLSYATSVGTGCSAKGKFVKDVYNGTQCDGAMYDYTTDTLAQFNIDMSYVMCTQIYNAQTDMGGAYNNNDDNDDGSSPYQNTVAYKILSLSSACSLTMYPNKCPNPYNLLALYESNMQKAINLAVQGIQWELNQPEDLTSLSQPLFITGVALILYSYLYSACKNRKLRKLIKQQHTTLQTKLSNVSFGSLRDLSGNNNDNGNHRDSKPQQQQQQQGTASDTPWSSSYFSKHAEPADSFDIVEQMRKEEQTGDTIITDPTLHASALM